MDGKNNGSFWPSYVDIMTTLFAITLILFAVSFSRFKIKQKQLQSLVDEYENKWDCVYDLIGREYDKRYRYRTSSYEFMSIVWDVFKKLCDKNLIYAGVKILPYDISARCCLSNFEANQEYKNINVNSLYVKFKINDDKGFFAKNGFDKNKIFFLIWR